MILPNFTYDIIKELGILSENGRQTKELNIISYNGAPAKADLRIWVKDKDQPTGKKMGKGLTLNEEELYTLKEILDKLDLEEPFPQSKGFTPRSFTSADF